VYDKTNNSTITIVLSIEGHIGVHCMGICCAKPLVLAERRLKGFSSESLQHWSVQIQGGAANIRHTLYRIIHVTHPTYEDATRNFFKRETREKRVSVLFERFQGESEC
jgi:hypothetical protein